MAKAVEYFSIDEIGELIGEQVLVKLGKKGRDGFPPDASGYVLNLEHVDGVERQYAVRLSLSYEKPMMGKSKHEHVFNKRQFRRHITVRSRK